MMPSSVMPELSVSSLSAQDAEVTNDLYVEGTMNADIAVISDSVTVVNTVTATNGTFDHIYSQTGETNGDFRVNAGGIYVPTTGGSPAAITYYEEYTDVLTLEGVLAGQNTVTVRLSRMNNIVTMEITGITGARDASAAGKFTNIPGHELPEAFRPVSDSKFRLMRVYNRNRWAWGMIEIKTTGDVVIYPTQRGGNFSRSGNAGFSNNTVSWFRT